MSNELDIFLLVTRREQEARTLGRWMFFSIDVRCHINCLEETITPAFAVIVTAIRWIYSHDDASLVYCLANKVSSLLYGQKGLTRKMVADNPYVFRRSYAA